MGFKLPIAPITSVNQYAFNMFLPKIKTDFSINLFDQVGNICLHINFRFTETTIVLNERKEHIWGKEKRINFSFRDETNNYKLLVTHKNQNELHIEIEDNCEAIYISSLGLNLITSIEYPPQFVDYPSYPYFDSSTFKKPALAGIIEDEVRENWEIALLRRKRINELNDFQYTSKIDNYLGIHNCLIKLGLIQDADNFILDVYQKNPKSTKISQRAIWAFKRANQSEKALAILKSQLHTQKSVKNQLDLISLLKEIGEESSADKELNILQQQHPSRLDVLKACAYHEEQKQNWHKAIEYWQKITDTLDVIDDHTKIEYARCQLMSGDVEAAKKLVRETKIDWQSQTSIKAHAWTYQQEGKLKKARQYWLTMLDEHPDFEFLRQPELLNRLDRHPIPNNQKEVRAFITIRNEKLRIQEFLRHHRQIGIDRFFFIDNGSTDYTLLKLIDQPDVHVFSTDASFGKAGGGTTWQNQLLDIYGLGHWCLRLDIDEQFLYPYFEALDIHSFCDYLDSKEFEGVFGFMLDMYGLSSLEHTQPNEQTTLLQTCPYFDSQPYNVTPVMSFPPKRVTGGVRNTIFWNIPSLQKSAPILHKVPLVKWQKGFKYTSVAHSITPLKLADVSCILLHYKFLSDFHQRALLEAQRQEMFNGASEYVMYLKAFQSNKKIDFASDFTTRFAGSFQLIKLDILKSSPDFNLFLKNNMRKQAA